MQHLSFGRSGWLTAGYSLLLALNALPPGVVSAQSSEAIPVPVAAPPASAAPLEALNKTLLGLQSPTQRLDALMQFMFEHPSDPSAAEVKALFQQTLVQAEQQEPAMLSPLLTLLEVSAPVSARVEAAQTLGKLQDPRVISALSYVAWDLDGEVQVAAVRALGQYHLPAAEAKLKGILDAKASKPVQLAAVFALAAQGTESARDSLADLFRNDKRAREVRSAAGQALEQYYPGHLASLGEGKDVLDRRGRALLIPASVGFGAYGLGVVGRFGKSAVSIPVGVVSGGILGGAASYLLTQRREMTMGQAGTIVTGGGWGLWAGLSAGKIATFGACGEPDYTNSYPYSYDSYDESYWAEYYSCLERQFDGVMVAGLLGEGLGLAATSLTLPYHRMTFGDTLVMNLGGLAGWSLATGLQGLAEAEDSQLLSAGTLASSLTTLGLATWVTPRLRFSTGDVGLTVQGALQGAWIGSFLPIAALGNNVRQRGLGGMRVGASLGLVAGAGLAQITDFSLQSSLFMTTTSVFGYLFGYGMPLMFGSENIQAETASMLTGGIAGLMGGLMLRDRVRFNRGDVAMTALGTGWGLWQGAGLGNYIDGRSSTFMSSQSAGMAFIGTALGGVTGLAVANTLDLSPWEVLQLGSGGMWGVWYSIWGGGLYQSLNPSASGEHLLLLTVLGSDLGLATSAVLLSPLVNVHPTRMGWTNLGGMCGAALFTLGSALLTDNQDGIAISNLLGTTLGLGAGAYFSSRIEVRGAPKSALFLNRAMRHIERWQPSLAMVPYSDEGKDGRPTQGWMLTLSAQQPVARF